MIIILTGPTGSGKTKTAGDLLKIFNNIVFLDSNWFASMQPFSWDSKSDVAMVYELLGQMIDYHMLRGKQRFVITLTSQMAAAYVQHQALLNSKKTAVSGSLQPRMAAAPLKSFLFRLRCSEQELAERIDKATSVNKKQEEQNALRQQKFFDTAFPNNNLFMLVDVTTLRDTEVVRKIRDMINGYDKLQIDAKKLNVK